jgi:hypothetical protein
MDSGSAIYLYATISHKPPFLWFLSMYFVNRIFRQRSKLPPAYLAGNIGENNHLPMPAGLQACWKPLSSGLAWSVNVSLVKTEDKAGEDFSQINRVSPAWLWSSSIRLLLDS